VLSSDRLARAVVRLRSERPADWRDELDALNTTRMRRLKHASVSELSALSVSSKSGPKAIGPRSTIRFGAASLSAAAFGSVPTRVTGSQSTPPVAAAKSASTRSLTTTFNR
jgi:hypothetical protein